MPSGNWFLWSNPIRDFCCVYRHLKDEYCQWTLTIQCWFWSFCDTSYFFSVFVVAKSHVCITRTLFCCKNFWWMCLTILDCIFVCNLNRRVRLVILNLFAVLWKEHRNIKILDVIPFLEGWLIRPGKCASISLFCQTTVVLSTSTIVFVRRKDFKGNDAQAERCLWLRWAI